MSGLVLGGDTLLGIYSGSSIAYYTDPINATQLVLSQPAADKLERQSTGKSNYGTVLDSVQFPKAEELSITYDEAAADLLAYALRGTSTTFTQSSATAQSFTVTAKLGKWVKLPYWPVTAGSVAISGKVEGTDFSVNTDAGLIKALTGGSIADGASVSGTLTKAAASGNKIAGGIVSQITVGLILDGKNLATGNRCRLEIDKAVLSAEGDRNLLDKAFLATVLKGTIVLLTGATEPYRYHEFA